MVRHIIPTAIALLAANGTTIAATPPAGCFGTRDVNVCYSPWKVYQAEPGYSGVVMRKGPYVNADPICREDTSQPVVVPLNHHLGRLSNRDGGVSAGCPNPGPRPFVNGFVWVYWPEYGKQGWVPFNINGTIYTASDENWTGTLCGPAAFDWDCRYDKSACPLYHGCGGSPPPSSNCASTTYHQVIAVGTTPGELSEEKYYLRYAPDSTTFFWLVPGDIVQRSCYTTGQPYSWSCVVVQCAQYAPNNCRGWIRSDALGPPISPSQALPCFRDLPCPGGSGVCNTPFADIDDDDDVDQEDFGWFQKCMTGQAGGVPATCECFDRDYGTGDGDIDQLDFDQFQLCISGPGTPADPACAS